MQKKRARTTGFFAFLAILLFGFTPMLHADPGVKDDGQFFKPETVEKANAEIRQIKADYAKDLVIETFAGVPEGLRDEWDAAKNDAQKRSQFFGKWSGDRAHHLQVNGVYVLICKDPGHLEVKAGQKTKLKAFKENNQNKLRDLLLESFKAKNDDEGLLKGVDYFREALKENLGGPHPATPAATGDEQFKHVNSGTSSGSAFPSRNPPGRVPAVPASSTFQWSSIMSIILIIIAAFVIIRVLARLTGGSRNSGGGYGPGQGSGPGYGAGYGGGGGGYGGGSGGGGFFRNMFGGLLGGAAGSYLYDQYRDRNNPAQNSQNYNAGNAPDNSSGGDFNSQSSSDDNDRGQGFGGGGSGGDFGSSGSDSSSSSGGDFGSSSSDSGSSGGGDSGGGGGDF